MFNPCLCVCAESPTALTPSSLLWSDLSPPVSPLCVLCRGLCNIPIWGKAELPEANSAARGSIWERQMSSSWKETVFFGFFTSVTQKLRGPSFPRAPQLIQWKMRKSIHLHLSLSLPFSYMYTHSLSLSPSLSVWLLLHACLCVYFWKLTTWPTCALLLLVQHHLSRPIRASQGPPSHPKQHGGLKEIQALQSGLVWCNK